ncbi:hypothetical protein F2Q69_00002997 [Brassica cretica]|uniref:TRUD domain-containing protein n=1 Tax=Brassica cretica TaxID=69181 RepID=A0A8S9P6X4_BRACR|nr:hypothetical protein F2Q69_00002997 [Brassica cretica]
MVTVFKQQASKLAALNKRLFGIKVGDFCLVKEGLLLGQLMGNRFTITLRGVVADSEETIKKSAESLGKDGFINFFGLQRFGSGSVPTHHVGAALLKGEWKEVVDMILDPRETAVSEEMSWELPAGSERHTQNFENDVSMYIVIKATYGTMQQVCASKNTPKSFGFSGTKDKRSVSTQRVTVFKQQASKLAALNKRLFGIKVGDFCLVKEGLLLGQLMGNRFTITLRGVVADSEETIKKSAESLGKDGFINYFGLQRFGSGSVPTHHVGAALLKGEWKEAVDMILDPREINEAREYYKETGDIDGTLRQLPRYLVAERAILQCLKKCPGNYLQALKGIPRTLRMMYVHSYQSYLWNNAASLRVQKYGTSVFFLNQLLAMMYACQRRF